MENPSHNPSHEIRVGQVKLAIWRNEDRNGAFFSVTVTRVFGQDEAWPPTASLHGNDLAALAKAADLADSWIHSSAGSLALRPRTTSHHRCGPR